MVRQIITAAVAAFVLSGCVSQEKYNAMKLEKDAAVEQSIRAQNEAAKARSEADAWKAQLDAALAQATHANQLALNTKDELNQRSADYASLQAKYEELLNRPQTVVQLAPEVTSALADFARQNPGVVEFDEQRGILKLKSDVTFAKGSAELTPQAKQAIAKVAEILNKPAAKNYELMVAGHTDSTPVSNPETIRKGHLDNWYLSAHRAIAVGKELMNNGVPAKRLAVAGYGAERPIAPNSTAQGQARNRRVEIAILPPSVRSAGTVAGTVDPLRFEPPAGVRQRTGAGELNKDIAGEPGNLNKDTASIGSLLNK